MIKPTTKSKQKRPVSKVPAYQLPASPFLLDKIDKNGDLILQLSAGVNVPLVIAGGLVTCTVAFYDNVKSSGNNDNPPVYTERIDFSAFIDNDSLRVSTLLYGAISNQQSSVVRPIGSKSVPPGFSLLKSLDGFVARSGFSKLSADESSLSQRNSPIDLFVQTGKPGFLTSFVPKDISTRNPRSDGTLMGNNNPADYSNRFSLRPTQGNALPLSQDVTLQIQRDYRIAKCRASVRVPANVLASSMTVLIIPGTPEIGEILKPGKIESLRTIELAEGANNLHLVQGLEPPRAALLNIDYNSGTAKVQIDNPNDHVVTIKISRFGTTSRRRTVRKTRMAGIQLRAKTSDVVSIDISGFSALFLAATCTTSNSSSLSTLFAIPVTRQTYHSGQIENKILKNASARILARNNSLSRSIEVLALIDAPIRTDEVTIKRRQRSLSGAILAGFEAIPNATIESSGNTLSASDTNLRHDYIYEYASFSLLDNRQLGMSSFVLFRDPLFFAAEVGVMSVQSVLSTGNDRAGGDSFDVGIKFDSLRLEDTLTSLLNATDGSIETSSGNIQIGNYIENIKNNREKLTDLFRISVIRQDIDSGREHDLGSFPAGRIIITDALLASKTVPKRTGMSNYVFRLLQRNASTLFAEIEEVITDPDTQTEFRMNISKFLGPLNLVSSIIPSSLRLRKNNPLRASKFFPSDDFLEGFTGSVKTVSVGSPSNASASGDASFRFRNDSFGNNVFVTVNDSTNEKSIGYILSSVIGGVSIPIGFIPAGHSTGLEIEDSITGKIVGPRVYTATFMNDILETFNSIESQVVNGGGNNDY